jgi:hypothetical protein|tara:strand:- start:1526 stop:2845 length:1320 start_codon:yes stop_codon:yes gene_type:complete
MQRYFRTLLMALFAAVSLGACSAGGPATAPGGPASTDASQGFAAEADSSKLIFVVPVEGMYGAARLVLADAIAALLRDARKPAILTEKANRMGPTVTGRIVKVEERDSVVWVTAVWELRAPYGTAIAEYRQQVVTDSRLWMAGSAEAINLLVFDAGPKIVAMVHDYVRPVTLAQGDQTAAPPPAPAAKKAAPGQSKSRAVAALTSRAPRTPRTLDRKPAKEAEKKAPKKAKKVKIKNKQKPKKIATPTVLKKIPQPPKRKPKPPAKGKPMLLPVPGQGPDPIIANPPPVTWKRPAFLIRQVQGAPGDGNEALTGAMKKALRKRDMTVTEDPRQAGFVIQGRVKISVPVGGHQQAKIVWVVSTLTGEEVGKAVQENVVRAGSLNGPWRRTAEIVSNAAVAGIQELFGIESKQFSRRSELPKFSGGPDLPQVPGRAPPPPK